MPSTSSRTWLALVLSAVFIGAVGIGLLLAVVDVRATFVTPFLAAGVGAAVVAKHMAARRQEGVEAVSGGEVSQYPVQFPGTRTGVGSMWQTKRNPSYAPGVLAARSGYVEFYPSKAKYADRTWGGPVTAAQLRGYSSHGSAIRVHGPHGSLQFTTSFPKQDVLAALSEHLTIVEGWTAENPTR